MWVPSLYHSHCRKAVSGDHSVRTCRDLPTSPSFHFLSWTRPSFPLTLPPQISGWFSHCLSGMSHINLSCFSYTSSSVLPTKDPQLSGVSPSFFLQCYPPSTVCTHPSGYSLEVTSLCLWLWSPLEPLFCSITRVQPEAGKEEQLTQSLWNE